MTPSELETHARRRYNAVGDTFWSQQEILDYLYNACLQMAREALVIEQAYTTTTVAGTQEYAYPTNTIQIKRVTYNGSKLQPINFREDDALTGFNASTTAQGSPQYYAIWDETLILRPIPDAAQTLKIYSYNEPQAITITSTLEVPSQFHMDLLDYVNAEMAAKDENFKAAEYYMKQWADNPMKGLMAAKRYAARKKRGDAFAAVQDEERLGITILGMV